MGMMAAPGPYGGSYGQCGGQSLGPQLQNKAGQPNSINQFNMDKKPQHGQNMGGMVRDLYRKYHSEPHPHIHLASLTERMSVHPSIHATLPIIF